MVSKDRGKFGERHHGAKLTWEKVADIRSRVAAGAKQSDLAAEYGVGPMTISQVVNRITWRTREERVSVMLNEVIAARRGRKRLGGKPKLTLEKADEIRRRYAIGDKTQEEVGREFGVTGSLVCMVVNGKKWSRDRCG